MESCFTLLFPFNVLLIFMYVIYDIDIKLDYYYTCIYLSHLSLVLYINHVVNVKSSRPLIKTAWSKRGTSKMFFSKNFPNKFLFRNTFRNLWDFTFFKTFFSNKKTWSQFSFKKPLFFQNNMKFLKFRFHKNPSSNKKNSKNGFIPKIHKNELNTFVLKIFSICMVFFFFLIKLSFPKWFSNFQRVFGPWLKSIT